MMGRPGPYGPLRPPSATTPPETTVRHLATWLALFVACAPGAGETDGSGETGVSGPDRFDAPVPAATAAAVAGVPAHAAPVTVQASTDRAGIRPRPPYLDRYDFDEGGRSYDLPGRLDEVSGLAVSVDGRLFAHDDERGRIHEIDPRTGEVGKRVDLGSGEVRNDFEGIATVGDRFFMVSSDGFLYEFREGEDEENVGYRAGDTGLGDGCEIEGLDHDPAVDALLLACKEAEAYGDFVVIHRIPMGGEDGAPTPWPEIPTGLAETLPPILIPRADLTVFGLDTDFQASAVLATPAGTILLTSAATEAIVEVDGVGRVLGGVALSPERHPQAEGLALGPDGALFIADEENDDDARLTRYAPRGSGDR